MVCEMICFGSKLLQLIMFDLQSHKDDPIIISDPVEQLERV